MMMMMGNTPQQQQQQQQQASAAQDRRDHHIKNRTASHDTTRRPSTAPRLTLSRSISYPTPLPQPTYSPGDASSASLPVPRTALADDPQHTSPQQLAHQQQQQQQQQQQYIHGLGISLTGDGGSVLPSADSPFASLTRYASAGGGAGGQPQTPQFGNLRSTSPSPSVWSASDQGTTQPTALTGFIPRLHKMVSDEKYQHLISWNASGTSFFISKVQDFASTVLPSYFKHSNFSSFVRQLNMYGFHKVNKTPRGSKVAAENQVWEFSHTKFIRHRPDLLDEIKRRVGDADYIREGDISTAMTAMQVQQKDILKELNSLHDAMEHLAKGLTETRERQTSYEEQLKTIAEYVEKQSQSQGSSPSSSQGTVTVNKSSLQRKLSLQRTTGRRPANITRLTLEDSMQHRRYSSQADLEFVEGGSTDDSQNSLTLRTPSLSSPPISQTSSQGSNPQQSPISTKTGLRAAAPIFSTPTNLHTPTGQYTPSTAFTSLSNLQRAQSSSGHSTSPTHRRQKSNMILTALPSPNVTPTPSYQYPTTYPMTSLDSPQMLQQQQDIPLATQSQSTTAGPQTVQPPATYQSAVGPYATPPRISSATQYTTPFQVRSQDAYVQDAMTLASPAFGGPGSYLSIQQAVQQQQQQQQDRRRRQDSDVMGDDMDLGGS